MRYDFARLFAVILEAASANDSFTARMQRVVDECAAQQPHGDWALFRELPYDEDRSRLSSWLTDALGSGVAPAECKGIWFGLVQVACGGTTVADMYASSTPRFDPAAIDWAYEAEHNDSAYLHSSVLAQIYQLAYGRPQGLGNTAEYPLALAYGALAGRAALEEALPASPIPSAQGAAVGYDDGDFLFLGEVSDGRFLPRVRAG